MKAGDILVELDTVQIQAQKRQAEASLLSANAALEKTKRSLSPQQKESAESSVRNAQMSYDQALEHYNRIKELYDKGYATQEEITTAETDMRRAKETLEQAKRQLDLDLAGGQPEDIEVAKANVAIRQAELDDINEQLANTTIKAPINGRVLTRPVEIGTAVASGTSGMSGGTVVATIGDMSTLYVQAKIDETDLGRVSLGMPCRVTFDAYPSMVWNGKLKKIYPEGEVGDGGTRFPVDVELSLTPTREGGGRGGGRSGGPDGGSGTRAIRIGSLGLIGVAQAAQAPPPGGGGPPPGAGGPPPGGAPPPDGGKPPSGKDGEKKPAGGKSAGAKEAAAPELKPNMTANVEFVIEDHPDVLIIEAKYIKYTPDKKAYCEVLPDPKDQTKRERRDIELGFSDGMRYEVTSGVKEGETVIIERPIEAQPQRMGM